MWSQDKWEGTGNSTVLSDHRQVGDLWLCPRYDTSGATKKNLLVFVTVSQTMRLIRLSTVKAKSQASATIAQHMPKQAKKNYTQQTLNIHKLNNSDAKKSSSIATTFKCSINTFNLLLK